MPNRVLVLTMGEPSSPEEAGLPPGVRQLGHGIMRRHPPENWMNVVDDVSSSWRFAEGVAGRFKTWMSREQGARAVASYGSRQHLVPRQARQAKAMTMCRINWQWPHSRRSRPPSRRKNRTAKADLAFPNQVSKPPITGRGSISMPTWKARESLYYRGGAQWWKVPVKKVKYHDKEEYDLDGAVEFEPDISPKLVPY